MWSTKFHRVLGKSWWNNAILLWWWSHGTNASWWYQSQLIVMMWATCLSLSLATEMCSERDSPLEPFVLPAPGQPELARLTCGAHLGPPLLTRKQKRPRVNSLVCDRAAAFCAAGPPEVFSRMSRPVTQVAERERELARARNQRLKQAAPSLPGESVSRGFADRGALEGYPSHYTSLLTRNATYLRNVFQLSRFVKSNCTLVSPGHKNDKLYLFLAATKQLYKWYFPSVRLSVCVSVRPSVCHTFFTMFPSSYHHEIFRSYYHGQKWCPCKRSRSEVKGQGHRGQHPT